MPQTNNLANIFTRLSTATLPANKDFYLFLLGTDVTFTRKPTAPERFYLRGELFSYSAQAIATLLGEGENPVEPKAALSFSTPSVSVLNGPSTLGSEVGERIAEGLLLILQAVANGKETLEISGHSRGGVEAILVLHELARIKKELAESPNKTLRAILCNSPCPYTRSALEKLFAHETAEDNEKNRALLLTRLNGLKTHGFFIDPVPGDIARFGWHDVRFYQSLPCDKYEYIVCRDERSSGFYPIVPEGVEVTVLPGHHGSIPGNLFTQSFADLPRPLQKRTTSVQDLALCKLFHFIHQATGAFGNLPEGQAAINLGHEALDKVLNHFLAARGRDRAQALLDIYLQVAEDDPAYRYFEQTHYAYLIRECAPGNYRYLHYHNKLFTSARDAFPEVQHSIISPFVYVDEEEYVLVQTHPERSFVNLEHVRLYLEKFLDVAQSEDADVKVVAITALLDNLLDQMREGEGELLTIATREPDNKVFFRALSLLVESISQKYLQDQLSEEEQAGLFSLIKLPFTLLAAAQEENLSDNNNNILQTFKDILQNGMKQAVETYFKATLEQVEQLTQKLNGFLTEPHELHNDQVDPHDYLTNLGQLHNKLQWLEANHEQLSGLLGEKKLDIDLSQYRDQSRSLISFTAKLLTHMQHDLTVIPASLDESFYSKVTAQLSTAVRSAATVVGTFFNRSGITDSTDKSLSNDQTRSNEMR